MQTPNSFQTTNDSIKELAEKDCMIITLEDQLQEKSSALEKACKTVQHFMANQKVLEKELNELRMKLEGNADAGNSTDAVSSNEKRSNVLSGNVNSMNVELLKRIVDNGFSQPV